MRSGRLRHSITIQQPVVTQDANGAEVITWSNFITTQASIEPLNGRELFAAQAINSEITGKIVMRYIPGVTAKMRVLFGSRVLDIKVPINVGERNKELNLFYSEGVTNG